jgi:hypothetical protein
MEHIGDDMADDVFGILRPANPDAKRTIIVLGTPRGGTSMVAATLRKLGVMMGERLGHQHEDPNFRGEVPLGDMLATVKQRNDTYDIWGWKLPNNVYYVEQLLPHLRNPHFVAVFRNPYSISRSSSERDRREYQARLLQVATNHTKTVVDLIGRLKAPTALTAFESAVRNREEFVRGLAEFVGVRPDGQLVATVAQEAINTDSGYLRLERPPIAPAGRMPAAPTDQPSTAPARRVPENGGNSTVVAASAPLLRPKEKRARRSVRVAKKLRRLPTTIDGPFFRELQKRWPQPPTIAEPVSQLCTASQFAEPCYHLVRASLHMPIWLHRKQWEAVYICRSLEGAGLTVPGRRGLGFGVGREKLPSLLVSLGCEVVATDLPAAEADGQWVGSSHHSDSLDSLFRQRIVSRDLFYRHASFRPVNMNAIPGDLAGFDFCWSACALEHLGSLKRGLDFIRNSLKCLNPGGLAVHTTEFNLGSHSKTLEAGSSVVYRERDITNFAKEMRDAGHEITLNLHPGSEPTDMMIDRDRNSDIHLRLYVHDQIVATSLGLCIKKAG